MGRMLGDEVDLPNQKPSLEELIAAALETKPMTPAEKKALGEEYRKRERSKPGRKKSS